MLAKQHGRDPCQHEGTELMQPREITRTKGCELLRFGPFCDKAQLHQMQAVRLLNDPSSRATKHVDDIIQLWHSMPFKICHRHANDPGAQNAVPIKNALGMRSRMVASG